MIVACMSLEAAHSCVLLKFTKQRFMNNRIGIERLGIYTGNLKDFIELMNPPEGFETSYYIHIVSL